MSTGRHWSRPIAALRGLGIMAAVGLLTCSTAFAMRDPRSPEPLDPRASFVRELERLTKGLVFVSESDYPLSVVYWRRPAGKLNAENIANLVGQAEPGTVSEETVDEFFRVATTPQPWHTAGEQAIVRRYQDVVRTLKGRLHDIHVVRFGQSIVHAYVMGITREGDWAGLSTVQIET